VSWNKNDIIKLKEQGKIRGFVEHNKPDPSVAKKKKSKALIWLDLNLPYFAKERGLSLEKEYEFHGERKFRSDWAFPELKILIEYEGGIFMNRSGHNSHTGIQRDIDKYSLAQNMGFRLIRITAKNYKTVLDQLRELIKQ
jgi:cytochrome oxidase assembly protein ShyY1